MALGSMPATEESLEDTRCNINSCVLILCLLVVREFEIARHLANSLAVADAGAYRAMFCKCAESEKWHHEEV